MAAPVAGPRMMMIANTTEPMAIGAQPGTARWSITPKITKTSMNADEIIPSWASEKATLVPAAITPVAAAEPAPTNTRNAVPSASARSFCVVVGGAAMRFALGRGRGVSPPSARGNLLETYSTSSNDVSRNVRRPGRPRQEGRSDLPEQIPAWLRGAGAEHPRRFLSVGRPAYDSPVSAEDATRPRRAPRPGSEPHKLTSTPAAAHP